MLKLLFILVVSLALPSHEQQDTPISPCPNVFMYEPPGTEPGRWYGVVNLSTDSILHSLWLNIVLDSKADILGNWIGDVSTQDNTDFKVENTKMKIHPGPAVAVRFFVQYNPLNKTPKLMTIRLNGREICNANTPQPAVESPNDNRPIDRTRPDNSLNRPPVTQRPTNVNRQEIPQSSSNINRQETSQGPVYVRPGSEPSPSNINGGGDSQRVGDDSHRVGGDSQRVNTNSGPNTGVGTTRRPTTRTTTTYRPPDISDYDVSDGDTDKVEYFEGPLIIIPSNNDNNANKNNNNKRTQTQQSVCGRVVLNNPIPLVVNGTPTLEGQWPWQIALYQTQTVDNKYICGGTLVTHRHIITAAHCVTRKNSHKIVNQNTLTVYLGKHNLRTSVNGVAVRFVEKITVHPQYNASSFSRDLAILELREPVQYSDHIRPACLWPENNINLNSVIGQRGSVVGWGFDDTGVATEELSLVEMPVVDQETCIRSYSEFFVRFTSEYTYCAGYRDGVLNKRTGVRESTSVCNGDSGGGMVFNLQNSWHLRGLVSLSVARQNEYRCDPSHYVIFTDLAKFLPWIKQNIYDY